MSPWSVCEISAQLDLPRSTVSDIVKLKCPEQQQLNHEVVNWQTHRAGPIKPDHLTITHCTLLNCIWKRHQHMNYDPGASWNGFLWLSSISWSEARNNWLQRSGNVMNSASLSGSLMDDSGFWDTKFTLPTWMNTSYSKGWLDNVVGLFVRAPDPTGHIYETAARDFNGCSKQRLWFHQARRRSTQPRMCTEFLTEAATMHRASGRFSK